jgi:hypothetical protein
MEQKTCHQKQKANSRKQVCPFSQKLSLSLVRQVHGLEYEEANVQVMLIHKHAAQLHQSTISKEAVRTQDMYVPL